MTREEAKEYIKGRLTDFLEATGQPKKGKRYICPICQSGSGKNGNYDSAFSTDGEKWHCFACNNGGDIYNLIALIYGIDIKADFSAVLETAAATMGIVIDGTNNTHLPQKPHLPQITQQPQPEQKAKVNYRDFLEACKKAVSQTDYYASRGLTEETVERFSLGVITEEILKEYSAACNLGIFRAGDCTIPYSRDLSYFIVRNPKIAPNQSGNYKHKKPKTEDAGKEPVFNEAELDRETAEPVYIAEAPLDAISIAQAGGAAIAIGGTGQEKLEKALDTRKGFSRSFIIAFDNPKQDAAGQTATEKVKAALDNRGIKHIEFTFPDEVKDCNAYLMEDKGGFYKAVEESKEKAIQAQAVQDAPATTAEEKAEAYNRTSGAARLEAFKQGIKDSVTTPPTPTGFSNFDSLLDGGLYEGLYILGAISSLGKTTFLLQVADQIANIGKDVLIFSLEMAASELIAKSISRTTYQYCKHLGKPTANAKTVRGILDGTRYKNYSQTEKEIIEMAIYQYGLYGENIFIHEGIGDIGAKQIRETIEEHIAARGKTPVVIIDYLQILAPYSERASDKQNTDKAVLELKRIARDKKTPVIAVSSFNRGNYAAGANMAAFKESGAIEYSADVLIALQPKGMKDGEKNGETNAETVKNCKASTERTVEAVILKNRNGQTGKTAAFDYNAMFNCYEESEEDGDLIKLPNDFWTPFSN